MRGDVSLCCSYLSIKELQLVDFHFIILLISDIDIRYK